MKDDRPNAVTLLEELTGEILPRQEQVVTLAKQRLFTIPTGAERAIDHTETLATVLRTGGIFQFCSDDLPPAPKLFNGALTDLPPLPFPRVWYEIQIIDPGEGTKTPYLRILDLDGNYSAVLGFAILEITPATHWRILVPMLDWETLREAVTTNSYLFKALVVREWQVKADADGVTAHLGEDYKHSKISPEWKVYWERELTVLPEFLTQVVNTQGVTIEPTVFRRPVRRRFTARTGLEWPQIYTIRIGAIGDSDPNATSERNYRHRWLVRGHYRRHQNGQHLVPGKGQCAWVRPYVKGPEGAPWKGRPVYQVAA